MCRCVAIVVVLIGIIICYLSCAILFSPFPTERMHVCVCVLYTNVSPTFRCVRAPYTYNSWNVCLCSLCKHSHVHRQTKRDSDRDIDGERDKYFGVNMYRIFYPVFWGMLLAFPLHQCTMIQARTRLHASHLQWDKYKATPSSLCTHKKFRFFICVSVVDPFLYV